MTKTQKQIIDDFFFEHLSVEPESDKTELSPNALYELYSLAKHIIGLRISLRSSGHIKDVFNRIIDQRTTRII